MFQCMNLEAGQVGVVLFGSDRSVREGETVKRTGQIVSDSSAKGAMKSMLTSSRSTFRLARPYLVVLSTLLVNRLTARAQSTQPSEPEPRSRHPVSFPASPSTSPYRQASRPSTPWCRLVEVNEN